MDAKDALVFLEETARFGSVLGLERVLALVKYTGVEMEVFRFIHVAGTNGKGSTCAMLAGIFQAAGFPVGFYTSPHLYTLQESIRINGQTVKNAVFARAVTETADACARMQRDGWAHPTQFEVLTVAALCAYQLAGCRVIVWETGLGGRDDATNIIPAPALCVLTRIAVDHAQWLGDSLDQIAAHKCGIFKPGTRVITVPDQPKEAMAVIEAEAGRMGLPLLVAEGELQIEREDWQGSRVLWEGLTLDIAMAGRHQMENARTAAFCARLMDVPDEAICAGIRNVRLPARMEMIAPNTLLDGAHNPSGFSALCDTLSRLRGKQSVTAVVGMFADKDYTASLEILKEQADAIVATQPPGPRGLPAARMADAAKTDHWFEDPAAALAFARKMAGTDGLVCICGSLSLASLLRPEDFVEN